MNTCDLYLESGINQRETMVHVLSLPGCVLNGPTTAETLAGIPDVIRAWLRLLNRHGQEVDPAAKFDTRIMAHDTSWNTTGYDFKLLTWEPELAPLSDDEIGLRLRQIRWINDELADWIRSQSSAGLDAVPGDGNWPARRILLHLIRSQDGYTERILDEDFGFEPVYTEIEAGQIPLDEGLIASIELVTAKVTSAPREVLDRQVIDGEYVFTLSRALRRTAEHAWEHLLELSRRPGGPDLGLSA